MLYQIAEIIAFVLFLPVLMNIILPLGMLAGWLAWRFFRFLFGDRSSLTEKARLTAQNLATR